jgi:hypothetical protein
MPPLTGARPAAAHAPAAAAADAAPPGRRPAWSLGAGAGLFAAAWLLPVLAHALRADWILLIVLLLGTGSVLRAGRYLLDRLMLAGILLTGAFVAGGLLFSVWPWGLEPVPVTGTLLTVLVAAGLAGRRRPRLPTRLCGSDAIIVGAAALTAWVLLGRLVGRPFSSRLAIATRPEDSYAHFALFDTIHRLGGYAFLHPARAGLSVATPTQSVYPQGSHYLYAVLDIFLRSTTSPGPAAAEFSRYLDYRLAGFAFLVAAVTWSARWIAGPAMTGWRRVFICSVVASLVAAGPLSDLLGNGFDSETIGLALLALAIAVAMRAAGPPQEQVLLMAASVIPVCYAYNLYAPLALLTVAAAAVMYRRRLRRHWLFSTIAAAVALPVALLPTVIAERSGFSATKQLDIFGGGVVRLNLSILVGLALVILASMAARTGRRSPVWRTAAATVVLTAAAVGGFEFYLSRSRSGGAPPYYYFDKALTGAYVVGLVGFGAAGLWLRPARSRPAATRRPLWRNNLLPGLAACLIAVTLACGLPWGIPPVPGAGRPEYQATWAYAWWSGKVTAGPVGPALQALDRARLLGDGKPSLVFYSNAGFVNWEASFLVAVLNHDLGRIKDTFNPVLTLGRIMGPATSRHGRAVLNHDIAIIEEAIAKGPRGLRLIVADRRLAARLGSFARAHPGRGLSVTYLPPL